jgi:hypothetical protein
VSDANPKITNAISALLEAISETAEPAPGLPKLFTFDDLAKATSLSYSYWHRRAQRGEFDFVAFENPGNTNKKYRLTREQYDHLIDSSLQKKKEHVSSPDGLSDVVAARGRRRTR